MTRSDGTSAPPPTNAVLPSFFDALGVRPILGRSFGAGDAERLRTHPGVLLGYGFWRREFARDPGIVGRHITLLRGKDRRSQVDVWGVLPPEFREIDNNSDRDLWMPAETWATLVDPAEITSQFRWFNLIGRLAPGATAAQANQQVAAIAKSLELADPEADRGHGARAVSDFSYRMSSAGNTGLVLFAIVGSV